MLYQTELRTRHFVGLGRHHDDNDNEWQTDFLKEILCEAGTAFKAIQIRPSSSSPSLPPHKLKLTGSIPGAGTTNVLLMVTVSTLKLAIKMPSALKDQK